MKNTVYLFKIYRNHQEIILHIPAHTKEAAISNAIHRAKQSNALLLTKKPIGVYIEKR